MDLRFPTPLNLKTMRNTNKKPMESTKEVIQCLVELKIGIPVIIGEPDMYRFIYNINRFRRNTLPSEFKHFSKGRSYKTLSLPELNSFLIIRVK